MPTITINGKPIAFTDEGGGVPVVLLHGGSSSRRQWRSLVSQLSDRYRVFAPDLYGHGESGPWSGPDAPSLVDYCEIVSSLISDTSSSLHLVGHSHGGAVALAFAEAHPHRLRSLVLIEPTMMHLLRLAGPPEAWQEAFELGQKHIALVGQGNLESIADVFLPYWIGQSAWSAMAADRRNAIIATMPAVAQFWGAALREETELDRYRRVTIPTLLICGSMTRRPTREIIDLLEGLLPRTKRITIAGAGHMSPLSHADQVNAAIVGYVDERRATV